jgi:hypothetical protein
MSDCVLINTNLNTEVHVCYFLREVVALAEKDYEPLAEDLVAQLPLLNKGNAYHGFVFAHKI